MSRASSAARAGPRLGTAESLAMAETTRAGKAPPASSQGTGRRGGPSPAWLLALARGRDAERRVAGAARVATQVLDDVLRTLLVAGGGGALQTRRLRLHLLGGA